MSKRVAERTRKIAIALSGGGHRASLFGLGVLLYLTDAGRNRDVVSVFFGVRWIAYECLASPGGETTRT